MTVRLASRAGAPFVAFALLVLLTIGVGQGPGPWATAAEEDPSEDATTEPAPTPSPTPTKKPTPTPTPSPTPSPTPTATPTPSPTPAPSPSPTASPSPEADSDCIGQGDDEDAVSFGDVDRDCDGTLLLSEQGDPVSLRRTLKVIAGEDAEDRFEPTDFVRGTLVDFDAVSREGGTVARGSLIYTPPTDFTGTDRYTFFMKRDGVVRQVEVLVEVAEGEAVSEEPTEQPTTPTVTAVDQDAVDRALTAERLRVSDSEPRWDPPWMLVMGFIAALLLAAAAAWWLLVIVRIQDRMHRD